MIAFIFQILFFSIIYQQGVGCAELQGERQLVLHANPTVSNLNSENYYEILGLDRNATHEQIKQAYKDLALKNHPDKHHDQKEEYEKKFKKINAVHGILSDQFLKEWYDIFLDNNLGQHFMQDFVNAPEKQKNKFRNYLFFSNYKMRKLYAISSKQEKLQFLGNYALAHGIKSFGKEFGQDIGQTFLFFMANQAIEKYYQLGDQSADDVIEDKKMAWQQYDEHFLKQRTVINTFLKSAQLGDKNEQLKKNLLAQPYFANVSEQELIKKRVALINLQLHDAAIAKIIHMVTQKCSNENEKEILIKQLEKEIERKHEILEAYIENRIGESP